MKTGKTLVELAMEITRQRDAKRDLIARTDQITMLPETALMIGTESFQVNDLAHNQIGTQLGIPAAYYDRMKENDPDLLAENVNAWLRREPTKRLVRTLDGRVRAYLSDRYRPLENSDLAEAVLPVLMDLNLELVSSEITEKRLYLKAVDKRINRDIPAGRRMGDGSHTIFDTVAPAIVISNSEVGYGQLSVESGVWTRACTNLAVFSQASMKRRHVGARNVLEADNIQELLSSETRAATDKAIWLQVRDVVKGAFNEAVFDAQIDRIRVTTDQPIEADPVKVVEFTAKRFGMNDTERGSVLTNLIKGADLSRYGLFNAITRTAEDLASYDRASDFERIGGQIIDLSPSQWKDVSNASGNPLKMAA